MMHVQRQDTERAEALMLCMLEMMFSGAERLLFVDDFLLWGLFPDLHACVSLTTFLILIIWLF